MSSWPTFVPAGFDRYIDRFLVPSYTWFCFVLRVFHSI